MAVFPTPDLGGAGTATAELPVPLGFWASIEVDDL